MSDHDPFHHDSSQLGCHGNLEKSKMTSMNGHSAAAQFCPGMYGTYYRVPLWGRDRRLFP